MIKYLILLFYLTTYSQEVILTSGQYEYSIGQIFYIAPEGIQISDEEPRLNLLNNLISEVTIYPNPTKNNIIVNSRIDEFIEYEVFDLTGRLIKGSRIKNKETIFLESLYNTLYLIKINNKVYKLLKI
jgi:hypothetical protein